jgi:hypothetical protein
VRIVDGGEHASAGDGFAKPLAFADIVESSNKGLTLRTDDSLLLGHMLHPNTLLSYTKSWSDYVMQASKGEHFQSSSNF